MTARFVTIGCACLCMSYGWVLAAESAKPLQIGAVDALGVLMYSPTERQAIRASRMGQSAVTVSTSQKFDGVVRRSTGNDTVFWGGSAYKKGERAAPILQGLEAQKGGKRLRIGETLDSTTGQTQDALPKGSYVQRQK
ncbi:MAG: hypothetical protein RIR09_179 [Pseudomonadota bacterium]